MVLLMKGVQLQKCKSFFFKFEIRVYDSEIRKSFVINVHKIFRKVKTLKKTLKKIIAFHEEQICVYLQANGFKLNPRLKKLNILLIQETEFFQNLFSNPVIIWKSEKKMHIS